MKTKFSEEELAVILDAVHDFDILELISERAQRFAENDGLDPERFKNLRGIDLGEAFRR